MALKEQSQTWLCEKQRFKSFRKLAKKANGFRGFPKRPKRAGFLRVPRWCHRKGVKHASFAAVLNRHFLFPARPSGGRADLNHGASTAASFELQRRRWLKRRFDRAGSGTVGALVRPKVALRVECQLQGRVLHQFLKPFWGWQCAGLPRVADFARRPAKKIRDLRHAIQVASRRHEQIEFLSRTAPRSNPRRTGSPAACASGCAGLRRAALKTRTARPHRRGPKRLETDESR